MAVREAELAAEARNLELRRAELTREVEQRLAEAEKKHQAEMDEKAKDAREAQRKEAEARKAAEDAETNLHKEKDATRRLQDQAKLDGQRTAELEQSLKLKEEELSSLTNKFLKLEEQNSRVSLELAGIHQQAEDGFKSIIAASADVSTRVRQLDRHVVLPELAPDCRSLPEVAKFLRKTTASVRSAKN